MPFSGEVNRKGTFYRIVDGDLTLGPGEIKASSLVMRAIEGVFSFGGTVARKLTSYRGTSGSVSGAGEVSRTASFYRSVDGAAGFGGAINRLASFGRSVVGSITLGPGASAASVIVKRAVGGIITFTGEVAKVARVFKRTITGQIGQ